MSAKGRSTRATSQSIVAIVPARNEEASIRLTVKALADVPGLREVVVVADGATDRTVEEALGAGARVLSRPGRAGKGRALDDALDRVLRADVYLFVDGDVGETASEVSKLLEPVLAGELDLAVARFPPLEGGGLGLVRAMSGRLIRIAASLSVAEPLSGQRVMTREALWACRPLADGFGVETAMTIDAARLGFQIGEVPVAMSHRPTGRGPRGFAHRGRQGLDILRASVPRLLHVR